MTVRLSKRVQGRGITLIRRVFEGAPKDAINLGIGQPTDAAPPEVLEAARAVIDGRFIGYSPTAGFPELRQLIAAKLHDDPDPESVLVTAGSQQAAWVALMGLLDPGDDVLLPEPGYPAYRMVPGLIDCNVVPVPLSFDTAWRLDADAVERAWTPRTRALIVASPSNPTGMFAGDQQQVERLARLCEERDAWLIADEIYGAIRFHDGHGPLSRLGPKVLAINGLSKAFSCTGLRIGWLHAQPEIIRGVMPILQQVALCAPTIGQKAALAALQGWGPALFAELRERYGRRRAAICAALREIPGVRFHEPDGAFYVLADVSAYASDTFALAMRLRDEAKVITAPGESFGPDCGGMLRLSFASDPPVLREGIGRLAGFLRTIERAGS